MFAYAPGRQGEVIEALRSLDADAFEVNVRGGIEMPDRA